MYKAQYCLLKLRWENVSSEKTPITFDDCDICLLQNDMNNQGKKFYSFLLQVRTLILLDVYTFI